MSGSGGSRRVAVWLAGAALSVAVHAGLAVVLIAAAAPGPPQEPPPAEAELSIASLDAPIARPEARPPESLSDDAPGAEAAGARAGLSAIPSGRAAPAPVKTATLAPSHAPAATAPALGSIGERAEAVAADRSALAAREPPETAASPAEAASSRVEPALLAAATAPAERPEAFAAKTEAAAAKADPAAAGTLRSDAVPSTAAPSAAARSESPSANRAAASAPRPLSAPAARPSPQRRDPAAPESAPAPFIVSAADRAAATRPSSSVARAAQARPAAASAQAPTPQTVAFAAPEPIRPPPAVVWPERREAARPQASLAAPTQPATQAAAAAPPSPDAAPAAPPQAQAASAAPPAARQVAAALSWAGDARAELDAKSLATIQSFLAPGTPKPDAEARDAVAAALAAVPCARLEAAFSPETGGVALRGHVPDEELRRVAATRLEEAIGGAIPIEEDLLVLPSPQCAVLEAVSLAGLPQSTDQKNDPLVVGRSAQAKHLRLGEGSLIVLDLQGPKYPAFIHLDWYDASGTVTHLSPSDFAPLRRLAPDERFSFGRKGSDGGGVELIVAPPFGKDIAVILAASEPLHDGDRPLREEAGPYLQWLREEVARRRAADPAFRGEWAYMFIETHP